MPFAPQVQHFYQNRVAAITGAGSGIGQALARALGGLGCQLALSDVNATTLKQTAASLRQQYPDIQLVTTVLDTRSEVAVQQWAEQTFNHFGQVNFIFNNAGVALFAPVAGMSTRDLAWVMDVNFWGMVYGTQAFLPLLEKSGDGHIINTSSLFGLVAEPSQSAYNASKFAIRGYTEALTAELGDRHSRVKAYCVMPGGIKTNIANSARIGEGVKDQTAAKKAVQQFNTLLRMSPDQAASVILTRVAQGQPRILVGADAHFFDLLNRVTPAGVRYLMTHGPRLLARIPGMPSL